MKVSSGRNPTKGASANEGRGRGTTRNGGPATPDLVLARSLPALGFYESPIPSAIARAEGGRIVECNDALCAVTEYRRDELIGKTAFDLGVWDSAAQREEFIREVEERGVVHNQLAGLRTKTGRELSIRFSGRVIDLDGERWLLSTLLDVTDREEDEAAEQRRHAIERSVSFTARTFLGSPNWEAQVPAVLARLGEATDTSRAYLFRTRREDDGTLRHSLSHEWVAEGMQPLIDHSLEQGFTFEEQGTERWAEILAEGGAIHGYVHELPERERPILEALDVVSIAIVPVFAGSEWWGFLGLDECTTEREWLAGEIEALQAATGALGAAIERSRAERRIEEAEERYRTLVEQLPGIVYIDAVEELDPPRFTTIYMGPQGERIHGYSPEEMRSGTDHWSRILHPEDRERALALDARHYGTGEPLDSEYRVIAKDGRVLWFHDVATLVRDAEGGPEYSHGIQFDITERKRAEEALRAQDLSFSLVVETIAEGVLILDHEGRITFANSAAERILGMSREQIVGRSYGDPVWELRTADGQPFSPEDRPFARILETGKPIFGVELSRERPDGTRAVWSTNGAVLPDPSGAPIGVVLSLRDISEARQADARLRETEAKYRSLVEQIPAVSYVWDSDPSAEATFSYVSPQIGPLLGYTREEWEADGNLWIERIHPEDRDRVLEATASAAESGERFSAAYRYVARDGRTVWVHDQAVLLSRAADGRPGLFQGVIYDVSELKRAGEAAREAEERYLTLAASTTDAIFESDAEGILSALNTGFEAITGWASHEWIGKAWHQLIHPDDRDRLNAIFGRLLEGGQPPPFELRMRSKTGAHVDVEFTAVPRVKGGRVVGAMGLARDVTERNRAEEALQEALRREQEASDRLRTLDDMKNAFLQAVSHELRTPLTSILGFALTLEQEDGTLSPEKRRDMLVPLAANARKLKRLLSDLLDVDRLARGLVEPRLAPIDLGALIRAVVAETDTRSHPVEIEAAPLLALVEAPKIERVVENLVTNAVKHTPPDSRIWVRLVDLGEEVLIEVEDDGPGIPMPLRNEIFQAFRQGENQDPHSPGPGTGLALVAGFTRLHGGRAEAAEGTAGGACFRVFLPKDASEPIRPAPRAIDTG